MPSFKILVAVLVGFSACDKTDQDGVTHDYHYVNRTESSVTLHVFDRSNGAGPELTTDFDLAAGDSVVLTEFMEACCPLPFLSRGDSLTLTSTMLGCRTFVQKPVADVSDPCCGEGPYDQTRYVEMAPAAGSPAAAAFSFAIFEETFEEGEACP